MEPLVSSAITTNEMFPNTLPANSQNALAILGKSDILKSAYMAGGSALALQLGHRRSVDFDFFTQEKFDTGEFISKLSKLGEFVVDQISPQTLLGTFKGTKFSLFYLSYPLISETVDFEGVKLASVQDISAMKLAAITGRGVKKDYVDLYFLTKEKFKFEQMFAFYDQKYGVFEANELMILKSLQYFDDAEESEMPMMIKDVSWQEVKNSLGQQVSKLWR